MKQIAYGRARRKMENGFTEMDGKCQSDLIEPQGIIKRWETLKKH